VIRFSGGAAHSPVWAAVFADVLETPIEIPAGSELGALGAAIAAAVALGLYAGYEEAVRAMTGVSRRYEPDGTRSALLAARFEHYKAALAALDPYWSSHV
jgi:L-xylulokinase